MNSNKKIIFTLLILGASLFFLRLPTLWELPAIDQTLAAYIGQQMREGSLLYRDLWEHRPPGIYFLYCGISYLRSNQHWIIPLFDMLYSLLTLGAIFLLAQSFWGPRPALGAVFFFVLFSLSPAYQGSWSRTQPELLINLPLLLGLYVGCWAHRQQKNWPWFFTGLALGAAFIIKFTALLLTLPLIPLLLAFSFNLTPSKNFRFQKLFYFLGGWTLLIVATLLYLYIKGTLPEAYEALIAYNRVYSTWREELKHTPTIILQWYKGQIIFTLAVFILSLSVLGREKFYLTLAGQILILWIFGGLLSIFLQGKYFEPHFLCLVPPFSLLAGCSWKEIKTPGEGKKSAVLSLVIVALLAGATGDVLRDNFHAYKPAYALLFKNKKVSYEQGLRSLPANNTKLELWELGKYIAQNSQEKDYIYAWAWAPEIYYYSGRPAPNRYIMEYYLMDAQNPYAIKHPGLKERQQKLLNNLKEKPVKFFLVGLKDTSIFEHKDPLSQLKAFKELDQWMQTNYSFVGRTDNYILFQKKSTGGGD